MEEGIAPALASERLTIFQVQCIVLSVVAVTYSERLLKVKQDLLKHNIFFQSHFNNSCSGKPVNQ